MPVASTKSFTVTASGAVIGGALSGKATSVEPIACGGSKLACAPASAGGGAASLGASTGASTPASGVCASARAPKTSTSTSAILSAT